MKNLQYNTEYIEIKLTGLSNLLSIELPSGIKYLIKYIFEEMRQIDFDHACKVLKYWNQRHFPMLGDFKEASKKKIENITVVKAPKIDKWQIEAANKLGIPIEKFVDMKVTDFTKEQRKIIGIIEPEEISKIFQDTHKSIKLFEK